MLLASVKTASISFFAGALLSLYFTARYKDAVWDAIINEQKIEAARVLQEATENVIRMEREQNEIKTRLEVAHVQSQNKLDNVLVVNRTLSNALGGLRDPGSSRASCKNTNTTTTNTARNTPSRATGNKLSNEASEFLLEFARDADRAADYAKTCHSWVGSLGGKK